MTDTTQEQPKDLQEEAMQQFDWREVASLIERVHHSDAGIGDWYIERVEQNVEGTIERSWRAIHCDDGGAWEVVTEVITRGVSTVPPEPIQRLNGPRMGDVPPLAVLVRDLRAALARAA
jgi:hypothetical protein